MRRWGQIGFVRKCLIYSLVPERTKTTRSLFLLQNAKRGLKGGRLIDLECLFGFTYDDRILDALGQPSLTQRDEALYLLLMTVETVV